ncbi:hypothetical protein PLESTB_000683700 [Pleodorina starrii]|uniref:Uncharacterized protein n=1 Tax=Pleodorina starrii TaxID=330485 RepID=A0A9W6BIM8_9CHLO|nr:hypothetical protein PLESTM_001233200 [Pleodorina starrii]GLC52877.1 hypothetical protein PLESTB_000683700 [Pleodorina starrii]GLC65180.1 hypothetical protein PLESTF_000260800 [Pleodorina starrii]
MTPMQLQVRCCAFRTPHLAVPWHLPKSRPSRCTGISHAACLQHQQGSLHVPAAAPTDAGARRPPRPVQRAAVKVWAATSHDRQGTGKAPPHVAAAVFTGTYAVIFGVALALAPKQVFGLLFGAETVSSGWIRVGGILFTLIGWQYLGTARADRKGEGALGFYRATIWSRLALSVAFALLVAVRESPPGLLVLAALNLFGAVSMHLALRRGGFTGGDEPDGSVPIMKM